MTLDPRIAVWLNIAWVVSSALAAYGSVYADLFGQHAGFIVLNVLIIAQGVLNAILHAVPSQNTDLARTHFYLGPKV